MTDEKVFLSQAIESADGKKILTECQDYMVSLSAKTNVNAEWIKGMGMLIAHIRDIPPQVRKEHERSE